MSEPTTTAPNCIINLDSEYKIKIETGNEFNNSIFADVYNQARQNVADILSHSNDDTKHDSYNNIIAFTGERGKGKSSTMISFLESLVNKDDKEHRAYYSDDLSIPSNNDRNDSSNLEESYNVRRDVEGKTRSYDYIVTKNHKGTVAFANNLKFSQFNFITIDVIDPSLFRREEQLFEIIVAKLFSEFRKNIEKATGETVTDEDRRELVKLFQQVFENLKYINNRQDIYKQDALDALIKLSTSSNLKENFDKLIQKYLAVFGKKDVTNFIVIAIDDFDLKIDGVYEMIEDIRQYFITKNIIILMACKMEQLRESIILEMTRMKYINLDCCVYERLTGTSIDNEKNATQKLIEKLVPYKREILLTDLDKINWENIQYREDIKNYIEKNKLTKDDNILFEAIIFELFKKDYFFLGKDISNKIIIPKTLRTLINLIQNIDSSNSLQKFILQSLNFEDILENNFSNANFSNYISQHIFKTYRESLSKTFSQKNNSNFTYTQLATLIFLLDLKLRRGEIEYREYSLFKLTLKSQAHDLIKREDIKLPITSLLDYRLLDSEYRLPKEIDFSTRNFDLKSFIELNSIQKNYKDILILSSFIDSLGREDNEMRHSLKLYSTGGNVSYCSVSIFNIFIAPLCIRENLNRITDSDLFDRDGIFGNDYKLEESFEVKFV